MIISGGEFLYNLFCIFPKSLYAFDGKTGAIFWAITSTAGEPVAETSNFYTPLLIPKDIDGDSINDIVGKYYRVYAHEAIGFSFFPTN